jgi:dTDP-4-dehydrorhamnose 3,5-epimerase
MIPFLTSLAKNSDTRGSFASCFPLEQLRRLNLEEVYVSASVTSLATTVRGMHFQAAPFEEAKLITVVQGEIFDVLINLDSSLPLDQRIFTFNISSDSPSCLFIPRGYAHGFQALSDQTIVLYALDSHYDNASTRGFSPLSPDIEHLWPQRPSNIKIEDLGWPSL